MRKKVQGKTQGKIITGARVRSQPYFLKIQKVYGPMD